MNWDITVPENTSGAPISVISSGPYGINRPGFEISSYPKGFVRLGKTMGEKESPVAMLSDFFVLAVGNRLSAVGNRPSAIGNRPSVFGYKQTRIEGMPALKADCL